jgi:hypothetical protein
MSGKIEDNNSSSNYYQNQIFNINRQRTKDLRDLRDNNEVQVKNTSQNYENKIDNIKRTNQKERAQNAQSYEEYLANYKERVNEKMKEIGNAHSDNLDQVRKNNAKQDLETKRMSRKEFDDYQRSANEVIHSKDVLLDKENESHQARLKSLSNQHYQSALAEKENINQHYENRSFDCQ